MHCINEINEYLNYIGFCPKHDAVLKTKQYLELLTKENKKTNLVGTGKKDEIVLRHFLDSLSILEYRKEFFNQASNIIDIGSGGGLPGLLLSIYLPDKKFYLLDKSLKKVNFLNKALYLLRLSNVTVIRGRAEQLARDKKHRECYGLVLARAVTNFAVLTELIIPFSKINGKIIFYKSRKVFEEVKKYGDFVKILGGRIIGLHQTNIPGLEEFRVFLEVKKDAPTPLKFPREFSKIKKRPAQ